MIAPLAATKKLYVYQTTSPWVQIKSAAYVLPSLPFPPSLTSRRSSALPANALILSTYKTTNPLLLRRRSPTIRADSRAAAAVAAAAKRKGPEIVEPCFIDETAEVDPTAKIGPNVSIGARVKVGYGVRVKDAIVLDGTILEVRSFFLWGRWGRKLMHGVEKLDGPLRDRLGGVQARPLGARRRCPRRRRWRISVHRHSRFVPPPPVARGKPLTLLRGISKGRDGASGGARQELHRLAPQDAQQEQQERGLVVGDADRARRSCGEMQLEIHAVMDLDSWVRAAGLFLVEQIVRVRI